MTGNLQAQCKDQDGILPIRREAWELIAPMPSTTGTQSSIPAVPVQPNFPQQLPNIPPVPQVPYQQDNYFGSPYAGQGYPQGPFEQQQNIQFAPPQQGGQFPMMVPTYWYYPCCQQCQQFGHHHYR